MANIPISYSPVPQGQGPGFSRQELPGIENGSQVLAGINSLFEQYNRNKQAQAQLIGTNLANAAQDFTNQANQANYRMANFGLSPQDINQGLPQVLGQGSYAQPAQPVAGSLYGQPTQTQQTITGHSIPTDIQQNGAGPAPGVLPMAQPAPTQPQGSILGAGGHPMGAGPLGGTAFPPSPVPQSVAQGQPGDSPTVSTLKNILNMRGHTAQLQAAQEEANLGKTQGEEAKAREDAALAEMWRKLMMPDESGMSWAQKLRDDVQSGRKAPSQAYTEASRLGPNGAGKMIVDNALAGLPVAQLEANYSGKTALANSAAMPLANTKSLESSLDVLDTLSKQAPRSDIQLINRLGLKAAAAGGNRTAQRLLTQAEVTSDMFQQNFGSGSDAKLELAQKISNPQQSIPQLSDSIKLMKADLTNRKTGLQGKEGTTQPNFNGPNVSPQAAAIIKAGLASGKSRDAIKAELKAAGH